ncbi:DUF3617 family protein [Halomonas sp. Bachu 37]|uniref:DUF3617 domain-containing protein n=1 Tax=Halomonas kashgarensis TaxID=3084920 RepID=UPI00321635AA
MKIRSVIIAAALAFPLSAVAEKPNIEPGQWEFISVTRVSGDTPIPDQTETERQCITAEEVDDETFQFIEEEEGCELLDQEFSADGVAYSMVCRAEGGEATIDGTMSFLGERVEGNVDIRTQSPMGELNMTTSIEGERIGEC